MKRLVVGLVATAFTVSACTHQVDSSTPEPTALPTGPTTAAVAPVEPPSVGDCFLLSTTALALSTNEAEPVPCRKPHTVTTVRVVRGTRLSESAASETCRRAVAAHLGAGTLELAATMARWVWFVSSDPSQKWVACDLVVFAGPQQLLHLPKRTAGWFDRNPEAIGICGTAAPGATGFERVICSRQHSWRVLKALPLPGKKYPGPANVRKAGDQRCADAVRISQNYALKFTYGWEWPTASQWKAGQHYGLCWTADS